MRPQARAIIQAIEGGAFRMDVPFLTRADMVDLVNSADDGIRILRTWSKRFTPANLGNLNNFGFFSPELRPQGLRNFLYSGRDLYRLLLFSHAVGRGVSRSLAVALASEAMRCYDEFLDAEGSEQTADFAAVDAAYLAVQSPVVEVGKKVKIGEGQAAILAPCTSEDVNELLRISCSVYIVHWPMVANSAAGVAKTAWRKKAQKLVEQERKQATGAKR